MVQHTPCLTTSSHVSADLSLTVVSGALHAYADIDEVLKTRARSVVRVFPAPTLGCWVRVA
jgi:hypothetical protein